VVSGKRARRKEPPTTQSVRTLILGIDHSGRIVQHDRTAPQILARPPGDLLGAHLSDLTADPVRDTAGLDGAGAEDTGARAVIGAHSADRGGASSHGGPDRSASVSTGPERATSGSATSASATSGSTGADSTGSGSTGSGSTGSPGTGSGSEGSGSTGAGSTGAGTAASNGAAPSGGRRGKASGTPSGASGTPSGASGTQSGTSGTPSGASGTPSGGHARGSRPSRGAPGRSIENKEAINGLLEAVKSDREGSAVLSIGTASGYVAEAVVTVRPMRAGDAELAALAMLQIPVPVAERFVDPAIMRDQLLKEAFTELDDTLDFDHLASRLMSKLVPHFCNAADLLILETLVGPEEHPAHGPDGSHPLRRLATEHDQKDPAWDAAFPTGEILRYPPSSPYVECIESGKPVLETAFSAEDAGKLARAWRRKPVAKLLSGTSMLLLPLVARGTVLGFFACTRMPGARRFDAWDVQLGQEFASRAAIFFDNARRFNREHATALTLQRSLLPTGLSAPSSVEVKHRYLPGSKLVEVGGDWYESIALPGARVALVVGDVAGHGVRAAVTMGRLRTAIQTLAMLELPPAESLQQLDELMHILGEREPHFATCAYALYDAVSGECELAVAGHLPPLLVRPDGTNELLDVTPAPPLGVGEGPVESRRFIVEDGSLFVLYTDGLVESKGRDISDGLSRLQEIFGAGSPAKPLEELCKSSLDGVYSDHQRDDIAVLIARLNRIPEDRRECWTLRSLPQSVREARVLIRGPMERWGLSDLIPVTELLVSELVTNAMRYAKGDIAMRLVLESGMLCCEVHDSSPALPRVLQATRDDENGRGLQVVSQLAARWGARRTHSGKVVWCEQAVPTEVSSPVSTLVSDLAALVAIRRLRSWPGYAACRCRGPASRRCGTRAAAAGC
jgi:serine phosphatase RsbU (regulator of sigma subunit)/anti-sigma regulatory factor (Ser/Thr protein kinase)